MLDTAWTTNEGLLVGAFIWRLRCVFCFHCVTQHVVCVESLWPNHDSFGAQRSVLNSKVYFHQICLVWYICSNRVHWCCQCIMLRRFFRRGFKTGVKRCGFRRSIPRCRCNLNVPVAVDCSLHAKFCSVTNVICCILVGFSYKRRSVGLWSVPFWSATEETRGCRWQLHPPSNVEGEARVHHETLEEACWRGRRWWGKGCQCEFGWCNERTQCTGEMDGWPTLRSFFECCSKKRSVYRWQAVCMVSLRCTTHSVCFCFFCSVSNIVNVRDHQKQLRKSQRGKKTFILTLSDGALCQAQLKELWMELSQN